MSKTTDIAENLCGISRNECKQKIQDCNPDISDKELKAGIENCSDCPCEE